MEIGGKDIFRDIELMCSLIIVCCFLDYSFYIIVSSFCHILTANYFVLYLFPIILSRSKNEHVLMEIMQYK